MNKKTKKQTISVVISAFNEESRLGDCLDSVSWVDEIIVIDNYSNDKTVKIAKKHGAKVFQRPNNPMLNINKNYGFSKATGVWILNIDADERVSIQLREEIKKQLSSVSERSPIVGYKIPRKNIIFGKWIRHTGWYPDYQLRLFIKGKGEFAQEHIHEQIVIKGEVAMLSNHLIHENYQTISQFITKLNHYTDNEAMQIVKKGYAFSALDAITMPKEEFFRRYFVGEGYRDGFHGLMLSMAMAMYHFVIFLKLWEHEKFIEPKEYDKSFMNETSKSYREGLYWLSQTGKTSIGFCRRVFIKLGL